MGFDLKSKSKSAKKLLHRGFKPDKCKTSLRLAVSRIKLLRNKKVEAVLKLKREIAPLLAAGQDQAARIRVEHVINEEKTMSAYELLGLYCELIIARLDTIESQKSCAIDLKEAISSVVFASQRCGDIPELMHVRKHFLAKYGKEFITSALEVRSDSGVNPMIIGKLSALSPDIETKVGVLTAIAKENGINWEPKSFEEQTTKTSENLMDGPATFEKASKMVSESVISLSSSQSIPMHESVVKLAEDGSQSNMVTESVIVQFDSRSIPKHEPIVKLAEDKLAKLEASFNSFSASNSFVNNTQPESCTPGHKTEDQEFYQSTREDTFSDQYNLTLEFKDATTAAQAAAEAAERASIAARAAAILASRRSDSRKDLSEPLESSIHNTQRITQKSMSSKLREPVVKDPKEDNDAEWESLAARTAILFASRGSNPREDLSESQDVKQVSQSGKLWVDDSVAELSSSIIMDERQQNSMSLKQNDLVVKDMMEINSTRMKNAGNASGINLNVQGIEKVEEITENIFSSMLGKASEDFGSAGSSSSGSVSSPSRQFFDGGMSGDRDVDLFSNTLSEDSEKYTSIPNLQRDTGKDGFVAKEWAHEHSTGSFSSMFRRNSLVGTTVVLDHQDTDDAKACFSKVEVANKFYKGMETESAHLLQENVTWKTEKYTHSSPKNSFEDTINLNLHNQNNENCSVLDGQETDQSFHKTQRFKDCSPVLFDDYGLDHDDHEAVINLMNGSSDELILSHQGIESSDILSNVVPCSPNPQHRSDSLVKESSSSYAHLMKEQYNDDLTEEIMGQHDDILPPTFDDYDLGGPGSDGVEEIYNILNHGTDSVSSPHIYIISPGNYMPIKTEQESPESSPCDKNDTNATNKSSHARVSSYCAEEQDAKPEPDVAQEHHEKHSTELEANKESPRTKFVGYMNDLGDPLLRLIDNQQYPKKSSESSSEDKKISTISGPMPSSSSIKHSDITYSLSDGSEQVLKKETLTDGFRKEGSFTSYHRKSSLEVVASQISVDGASTDTEKKLVSDNTLKPFTSRIPADSTDASPLPSKIPYDSTAFAKQQSISPSFGFSEKDDQKPLGKASNETIKKNVIPFFDSDSDEGENPRPRYPFKPRKVIGKLSWRTKDVLPESKVSPHSKGSDQHDDIQSKSPQSCPSTSDSPASDESLTESLRIKWNTKNSSLETSPKPLPETKNLVPNKNMRSSLHGSLITDASDSNTSRKLSFGLTSYKDVVEEWDSKELAEGPSLQVQKDEDSAEEGNLKPPVHGSPLTKSSESKGITKPYGLASYVNTYDKQDLRFLQTNLTLEVVDKKNVTTFSQPNSAVPQPSLQVQLEEETLKSPPKPSVEPPLLQVPLGKHTKPEKTLRLSVCDSPSSMSLYDSQSLKSSDLTSDETVDEKWNSSNEQSSLENLVADDLSCKEALSSSRNEAASPMSAESTSSSNKKPTGFGWRFSNFAAYFQPNTSPSASSESKKSFKTSDLTSHENVDTTDDFKLLSPKRTYEQPSLQPLDKDSLQEETSKSSVHGSPPHMSTESKGSPEPSGLTLTKNVDKKEDSKFIEPTPSETDGLARKEKAPPSNSAQPASSDGRESQNSVEATPSPGSTTTTSDGQRKVPSYNTLSAYMQSLRPARRRV